jgi:hypothetical protein
MPISEGNCFNEKDHAGILTVHNPFCQKSVTWRHFMFNDEERLFFNDKI